MVPGPWECSAAHRWVRFWDAAQKATQRSDYSAGAKCALNNRREFWIAHVVRGNWEYAHGKAVILNTAWSDGPAVQVGVEDTQNGTAVLSDLRPPPASASGR